MPTRHQLRRSIVAIGVTASLALVTTCSSDGETGRVESGASTSAAPSPTTVSAAPEGGYPVQTRSAILVDPDRPTADLEGTSVAPAPDRTLVTTFTYPDAPGPLPLIAFAHGLNGHPRKFTQLLEAWAAAGFVVVAPAFPLSNDEVPGVGTAFDLPNQPADLSFAITEALRMAEDPDSFLNGRVQSEQIAVAGLSLGGATVYLAAFEDCCRDPRVDAAIVMDGYHPAFENLDLDVGIPLLVMHADADPVLAYTQAEEVFAEAVAPKYLVTIHEAVHAQPYEDDPDPADQMVIETTTAFWRLHLAGEADAAADLSAAADVAGLTTVVEAPG